MRRGDRRGRREPILPGLLASGFESGEPLIARLAADAETSAQLAHRKRASGGENNELHS